MAKARSRKALERDIAAEEALLHRLEKREQLVQTLTDWPAWLRALDMEVDSKDEAPRIASFNSRPGSPHMQMIAALDDPAAPHTAIFAPRGTGKSYSILLPWVLRQIVLDPEVRFLIGSETLKINIELRTSWLRQKLELLEKRGFGQFKDRRNWGNEAFTVKRASGVGGQPTVVAWGPESVGTGRHCTDFVFDDLYGDYSADSSHIRKRITRRFERLMPQRMPGSRLIFAGTMWPGTETFYYRIRNDPRVSKMFKTLIFEERDKSGNPIWKSLPAWFLAEQKVFLPPALYDAQYRNRIVDIDALMFQAGDFKVDDPPPNVPLTTYIVTDSAYTLKTDRRSSRSCVAVIQKTADGRAYVMDIALGTYDAFAFPRVLLDMVQKWRGKNHAPAYYTMENQGPGGQYPAHIEDVAKLSGIDPPECHQISHARTSKATRIEYSRGPIRSGMICFSSTLDPSIFRLEAGGEPSGTLGDSYMNFSHDSGDACDGPDAIADAIGIDAYGAAICPAPVPPLEDKPLTPYERAVKRLRPARLPWN